MNTNSFDCITNVMKKKLNVRKTSFRTAGNPAMIRTAYLRNAMLVCDVYIKLPDVYAVFVCANDSLKCYLFFSGS